MRVQGFQQSATIFKFLWTITPKIDKEISLGRIADPFKRKLAFIEFNAVRDLLGL